MRRKCTRVFNPALTHTLLLCQLILRPASVELVKIFVESPGHIDHVLQVRVCQCNVLPLGVLPRCRDRISDLSAVHFLNL